ncbi:MAG TPA: efflux transporter outer membrane subunit [Burkholderiales bacterium]|jgi:NodT family efflux transporter outer membrane factor (OMF) lipoprotein
MIQLTGARAATVIAALLLSACTVGPAYQRPEVATPANFKEAVNFDGTTWKSAAPGDTLPRGPWWERFDDPDLNALAAQIESANPSLQSFVARYYQAEALIREARSAYFPTLNLNASTTRARNGTAGIVQPPQTTDTVSASVSGWELDLWGRIRNTVEANKLSAQASIADIENTKLSLQAQLVTSYLALRISDEQANLLDRTVDDYKKALDLTTNRYKAGVAARLDVAEAETQLKSTQAQALDVHIARAQFEHAIAVLIGKAPAEFSIAVKPLVIRMPEIPLSTPSALLERRPDVAAAERRIAAANASVGAAQAALFPTLSLGGTLGFRKNSWGNLLTVPNRFWSIGPALTLPVFDGGLRRGEIAQAEGVYDQNVADYRQAVLTAFQDVEDQLVALRVLEQEAVVQSEAVRSANESLDHTIEQYRGGTLSYLNVITAQTTAYSNRQTELNILNRRYAAAVALIKALGGGFDQGGMTAPMVPEPRGIKLRAADFMSHKDKPAEKPADKQPQAAESK